MAKALTIYLGQTARELRESLGLTQRKAAKDLGISHVHLCNIEKNRAAPSQALVDKYREIWGVDLHVLAWCNHGDTSMLPKSLRQAASDLSEAWDLHVESLADDNQVRARS